MMASVCAFLWLAQEQQNLDQGTTGAPAHAQAGHQAPDFSAETFSAEPFDLTDQLGQKGTVLYFWTSWCPYCQASSEAMEEAHQTFSDEVNIVGVNATMHDRQSEAESFISQNELTFKNILDEDGIISRNYYAPPVPATIFIDQHGMITYRKTGAISYPELESEIRSLVKEEE